MSAENSEHPSSPDTQNEQRSWLERISHFLSGEPKTRTELVEVLRDAEQRKLLSTEALNMIESIFQFSEMQVRDVMIPRAQMVSINVDDSPEDFIPQVIDSTHSRFPVVGENRDEILGILLAKDLLPYCYQGDLNFNLQDLIRPAVFAPESKRLNVLLEEFRIKRNHLAIVINEYGNVAGLVTIEDVLEQIVGEIEDEYDIDEQDLIKKYSPTNYSVKAQTSIEAFNEYFNAKLYAEEFDTVGGLVVHHFGHLPKRGESTEMKGFTFKILHADNRRVRLLQVIPKQKDKKQAAS